MYLGGFVIELLLKAKLIEKHPWLQSAATSAGRSQPERELWALCYRSHDLEELLVRLPEVRQQLSNPKLPGRDRLRQALQNVCERWTVFARYSPQSANIREAVLFLDSVKELGRWLR